MTGQFEELADNAPVMIWRSRLDNLRDFFNKPWLDFTGRTHEQHFGLGWTEALHADDHDRCLAIYTSAFDIRDTFSMEYRLRRHDGEYRWILDTGTPFKREGEFAGYFGSCIDITARKRHEDGHVILLAELNHRVKNMLSTVQALARQSCERASTPREAGQLLNGRLMALSQAHEILAEEHWKGAEIGAILRRVAALASRDPKRVLFDGMPMIVQPAVAQSLAMAFYELFLNAMQYGALSNDAGAVNVAWTAAEKDGKPWLDIVWQERGGPAVVPPESRGLGVRLIRSMLPGEISGSTEITFPKHGVTCRIGMPITGGMS